MTLNIGIEIPEDHITQKGSIFGVTGTGKSNGIGVLLEEYCKKQMPFCVLDVLGAHYGLAEKHDVIVYGGKKGIVFKPKWRGTFYAQVVHHSTIPVIFDMSEWNDFEMQIWCAEFLDELFKLHGTDRTPLHVFVEEAEVFFPQVNYDNGRQSLLAGNKVMKRGRALGLGMTLISQRPQDVNKKTLSQCQFNIIMHLEGVPEMKVVREMLRSEEKERRDELLSIVTKAKQGECLLYSPQWLGKPKSFKFRLRETFHAGYTPKLDEVVNEPNLPHLIEPHIQLEDDIKPNNGEQWSKGKILLIGTLLGIILYVVVSTV